MTRILLTLLLCACALPAFAKTLRDQFQEMCPQKWETQECLSTVSKISLGMAEAYEVSLKEAGHDAFIPEMKNLCAASTAASQGEYPANAMRSAFTECANGLYDLSQKTGIKPHEQAYPFLVMAVICLSGDEQCAMLEANLSE
jgi:hypothetical protein